MISVSILGGSGYSGAELIRLLQRRSDVRIDAVYGFSSAGQRLDEIYPYFTKSPEIRIEEYSGSEQIRSDLVFIALPSGEALKYIPDLYRKGKRIIDIGGDYRLKNPDIYRQYYRHEHTSPELLQAAIYGLPEINYGKIKNAQLVANPGCYPTGAILGLLPALESGLIDSNGIVINSMSGVTGAGRTSSNAYSFAEVNENLWAYKVGFHQHIPEIEMAAGMAAKKEITLSFVPHLVPMNRGIHTTIHANLLHAIETEKVTDIYSTYYAAKPYVRVRNKMPAVKDVLYTNYCDIAVVAEPRTHQLIILTVIDNLVKGAAGQAVQNMNIMFGLDETIGM